MTDEKRHDKLWPWLQREDWTWFIPMSLLALAFTVVWMAVPYLLLTVIAHLFAPFAVILALANFVFLAYGGVKWYLPSVEWLENLDLSGSELLATLVLLAMWPLSIFAQPQLNWYVKYRKVNLPAEPSRQ